MAVGVWVMLRALPITQVGEGLSGQLQSQSLLCVSLVGAAALHPYIKIAAGLRAACYQARTPWARTRLAVFSC